MTSIFKKVFGKKDNDDTKLIEDDELSDGPYLAASAFYVAVVLLIGLPVWLQTCSTTRYSLPNIDTFEDKLTNPPPKSHVDISVIQLSSNEQTDLLRTDLSNRLKSNQNIFFNINWRVRRATRSELEIFRSHSSRDLSIQNREALGNLEKKLLDIHRSEDRFRLFIYLIDESVQSTFCDPTEEPHYFIGFERFVYLCPRTSASPISSQVAELINSVLDDIYSNTVNVKRAKQILSPQSAVSTPSSSKRDLLISLIPENEDDVVLLASMADKLHNIFQKNVKSPFGELTELINIRLMTQNVIDLVDKSLIDGATKSESNATSNLRTVGVAELSLLFHKFESRVMGHSSQNVDNVLILVPHSTRPPLVIDGPFGNLSLLENENSQSMFIADGDESLVLTMRAIIRRLVGLSSVNLCKRCVIRRDVFLNKWELDSIMGVLTAFKLQGVYSSIKSLSDQRTGIRIPEDVSMMANKAHELASSAIENLRYKKSLDAYRLASQAYDFSEAAFYNPSLLDHPEFPEELKYAIYLPLFFPLAAPFVRSVMFLLKHAHNHLFPGKRPKIKIN